MRITSSILSHAAISGIQSQMRGIADAQRRIATGQRVGRPSDDPVAAAGILGSSSGLRALEQYRGNQETGLRRLALEDSVLDQVTTALSRAKELGISQATDSASTSTRLVTQAEVDQLRSFMEDLANTQFNDRYIFGGQYSDTPPYQAGAVDALRPPTGDAKIEIGAGLLADTNHNAQEIFVDSDAMGALDALSAALGADDIPGIEAALVRVNDAFQATQETIGDLGGRMSRLDVAVNNLDSLEVTLQTFRSDLADADLAEAVTELVNRQGTLEAAMVANSRILNMTLANYLR